MELVKPSVEYWSEGNDPKAHVARCAALCYANKTPNVDKIVDFLIEKNHLSMFRHWTHYYIVSMFSKAGNSILDYMVYCETFGVNPLINIIIGSKQIYVSTNHQFVLEHEKFNELMKIYEVSLDTFAKHTKAKSIIRFTFCITTSIKISRELNRVSPNNIAEQSTRYVNFNSKFGDVQVCESIDEHLKYEDRTKILDILSKECAEYTSLIESGVKPEDARRVLPTDTITRVAYTYTFDEWSHIIDIRYFETTGKAAPDAKLVVSKIYDIFKMLGYYE